MTDTWQTQGLCKGKTELFYAARGERPEYRAHRERQAKKYCAVCPVQLECLEVSRREPWGVWGGYNEEERGWSYYTGQRRGSSPRFNRRVWNKTVEHVRQMRYDADSPIEGVN